MSALTAAHPIPAPVIPAMSVEPRQATPFTRIRDLGCSQLDWSAKTTAKDLLQDVRSGYTLCLRLNNGSAEIVFRKNQLPELEEFIRNRRKDITTAWAFPPELS